MISKQEVENELEESLINGEKHENKDIKGKAEKVEKCKEAAVVIREFKEIIQTKRKNIWKAYQQGKISQRLKRKRNS